MKILKKMPGRFRRIYSISTTITFAELDWVEEMAEKKGITKSELLRRALGTYKRAMEIVVERRKSEEKKQ